MGVPMLSAHINDWAAASLNLANAVALWNLLDEEPIVRLTDELENNTQVVDADSACFDFFIEHFEQLAQEQIESVEAEEETTLAPIPNAPLLHELNVRLMR